VQSAACGFEFMNSAALTPRAQPGGTAARDAPAVD
jgi:hypothetical protein